MGIIYLMLIVSLVIALFFLGSYLWAIRSGQYDDDYSPSIRILYEEEKVETKEKESDGSTKV